MTTTRNNDGLAGFIQGLGELSTKKGFWDRYNAILATPNMSDPDSSILDYRKEVVLKLALIGTEVSEAIQELRNPGSRHEELCEETADIAIRALDLLYHLTYKDAGAAAEVLLKKHQENLDRPAKHGKLF